MVLDELDDERGLACGVGEVSEGEARKMTGLDGPTERDPRTAIFLFLRTSPGMLAKESGGGGRVYEWEEHALG